MSPISTHGPAPLWGHGGRCLLLMGALHLLVACEQRAAADSLPVPSAQTASKAKLKIAQRQGKIRNYPCNQCHDKIQAGEESQGAVGTHRTLKVDHFEGASDCSLCHDSADMDNLRMITGTRLTFDESQRLCGQCHGEKQRDWSFGAHGKHVGSWRSERYRLTCTDCHNPHVPRRPKVQARPAPPFPKLGIKKGAH